MQIMCEMSSGFLSVDANGLIRITPSQLMTKKRLGAGGRGGGWIGGVGGSAWSAALTSF